ncbi:MAG TPA: tetratricopeptide repeat protein [Myxococcota bacterium]|nr:tetratricopeptide repeat protein [Myxococcota bacterium]HRY94400.1 tetratricopeptide repeat protein [Myxococcota bacterium]HSA22642.1 tetratricopeptide repeat protein [Myxococcota bacterium]
MSDAPQRDMFSGPLEIARELKERRRFEEALQVLSRALEASPGDRPLKASLADLYYRMDRPREALQLAGSILREDPDDPRALVVMGNALLERKKPREALEYFRLALEIAPTDYLWIRLARCHLRVREPQAALQALDEAERLAPDRPAGLRLRAEAARLLNDGAAERQAFERAARAAPAEAQGFFLFLWPMLADLPPRRACLASQRLRENPGQERNPHLLLFEGEQHLASGDAAAARERLQGLLRQTLAEPVRRRAEELLRRAEGGEGP